MDKERVVVSLTGGTLTLPVASSKFAAMVIVQVQANECGRAFRQYERLRSNFDVVLENLVSAR